MLRIGLVAGGSAMGAFGAASYVSMSTVRAAGSDEDSSNTKQLKKKIRPSQLPIYGDPEPVELERIPEKISTVRQYVSEARQFTWTYFDSVKETTDKISDKYEVAKSHTKEALAYIQEDSAVLPRAAIITVSGLGGIVAGYKGGIFRKAVYASLAMAASAAVCYPNQAGEIGSQGWSVISKQASQMYSDTFTRPAQPPAHPKKLETVAKTEASKPATATSQQRLEPASAASVKKDYGMSKPDEKDMYTTRGS